MNIRTRAAQIRSRWLRTGFQCELSLDELEPLFSVYAESPRGKLVIIDKKQAITLKNLLSLSADEYNIYKLDIKARNQATLLHTTLSRFNQPVFVSIDDIYQIIRDKVDIKKKYFILKNENSPVTIENLILSPVTRTEYYLKLKRNADQKMIFWRKKGLEPKFTLTQLTEQMESVGYRMISSKKGVPIRDRIRIIDNEESLTLNNIEILVSIDDESRVRLSV
ncbi:hypothetical protein [Colwellia psychrerythraea]|uniref:Uncharacterized protein n=1 Tax=Colwellia psychrerythraea (strain 34H / ATCC BAA-681) TaxID=167879 RepID=Q484Y1_COLP3|nr:hypothetical protein [Colwellia psychrerythraea]AAZ26969.1 hypothetical protein CPS_1646 [Colwellia psychrerythraea 34H]